MVLLTITPAAKAAIELYHDLRKAEPSAGSETSDEPSLAHPCVGDAISHGQLIDISRFLQQHGKGLPGQELSAGDVATRLDALLKGARTYTPSPEPKPEPSPEYVKLMARLRVEEEERAYERMINPPTAVESFSQRFPNAMPAYEVKEEVDELVYADVNRQLALIINVLVSIICCSVAIWIAARHRSAPQRLALSMIGSGLVAAAEIVIFSGYIRRVREAKQLEAAKVETKEVVETWVIDGNKDGKELAESDALRYRNRKGKHR